ncbi:Uncharacterised protein [Burkholderia pseudomallei]|nr:Uncharacterised protein [Burkholderia pseudomallei]
MHSSVVRSAGGSEAGGDCADVRRAATGLRGTQRPSEPACALSAGARRGPGPTGRALRGTRNRDGGGAAGDPEGGRCVCAAGSEPSARAFAPDAGRYEPGGGARRRHRRGRARIVRITCRGPFAPRAPVARHRAMAGMQPGESVHPAGARRAASRIRDLHVGLERRAEGSDERASRGGEPAVVDAADVRAGRARRGIAKDAVQLRRIGVGVLLAADVGRFAPDAGRYEPGGGARRRHRRGRARIVRITCRGSFAPRAPVARHRAMAGMQPGESVHPAGARRAASRIRDLHVGLERRTEGSDERASRGGEPAVVDATDVRAGRARRGIAKDAVQLRRIGVGVLLAADVGRAAGDREAGGAQGSGVPVGVDRSRTRDDAALRTVDAAGVPGG